MHYIFLLFNLDFTIYCNEEKNEKDKEEGERVVCFGYYLHLHPCQSLNMYALLDPADVQYLGGFVHVLGTLDNIRHINNYFLSIL